MCSATASPSPLRGGSGRGSQPSPAAQEATALDLLRQAVDRLRRETQERPPGTVIGEELSELHWLIEALRAQFSTQLRDFDRSGGYAPSGALSAAGWLRAECRLAPSAAAEQVRVAKALPQLPETAEAFAGGQSSFQHVALISRSAEEVGLAVVQEAQPALLEAARQLDPYRLRLVTRHLRYCLDPEGARAEAEERHQRRALHLSQTLEGISYLSSRPRRLSGCLLSRRPAGPRGRQPAAQGPGGDQRAPGQRGPAQPGPAPGGRPGGAGPPAARRRPAAVGGRPAPPPHADRRAGQPGRRPGTGRLAAWSPGRRAAAGAGGGAADRLRRGPEHGAAGEAGEPLAVGRSRRVVSGALRRALVARDGGCRFPGCDRPPAWTDAHHVEHWADGGATALSNTVLLCRPHHRRVHEEGWRLVADGADGLRAQPP